MAKRVFDMLVFADEAFNPGAGNAYPATGAAVGTGVVLSYGTTTYVTNVSTVATAPVIQFGVRDSLNRWRLSLPIYGNLVKSVKYEGFTVEAAYTTTVNMSAETISPGTTYELIVTDDSDKEQRLKIWRFYEYATSATTAATLATAFIAQMTNARISAGVPFVASSGGAGIITLTGKTRTGGWPVTAYFSTQAGVGFTASTTITNGSYVPGSGNYFQVQDDESVYQGYKGYLNRVWAIGQQAPPSNVSTSTDYQSITIEHQEFVERGYANTIGQNLVTTKLYFPQAFTDAAATNAILQSWFATTMVPVATADLTLV